MPRGYNVKFNKALFRRLVDDERRALFVATPFCIIGVVVGCLGAVRWNWSYWLVVPIFILSFWAFVVNLFFWWSDRLEYNEIHGNKKAPKKPS